MKLAFTVQYNGKNYFGFQKQKEKYTHNGLPLKTIQQELEKAISMLFRQPINIYAAGRTDAKVNALGQVIHFEVNDTKNYAQDIEKVIYSLNSILPQDISIVHGQKVAEDFHARFSCLQREYVYLIYNSPVRSALLAEQTLWLRIPLDVLAMQEAAKIFIGEKDFAAFTQAIYFKQKEKTIRRIDEIAIEKKENLLSFYFLGSGFLHNMIRIIIGTLIEVGKHKLTAKDVENILLSRDRTLAGKTLPPHALYFAKARYKDYDGDATF